MMGEEHPKAVGKLETPPIPVQPGAGILRGEGGCNLLGPKALSAMMTWTSWIRMPRREHTNEACRREESSSYYFKVEGRKSSSYNYMERTLLSSFFNKYLVSTSPGAFVELARVVGRAVASLQYGLVASSGRKRAFGGESK